MYPKDLFLGFGIIALMALMVADSFYYLILTNTVTLECVVG